MWIVAVLLGVEFNAEIERTREIERGVPGAREELELPERDPPKQKQRPSTA